nr:TetR/AcrR family transcriptional regulator C-terminal domain-containing protein [Mangrovicella endophytica]
MAAEGDIAIETLTERQRAVLDAALALIVAEGQPLTMSALARSASCSKETLYKWFGDRDGLLTATVRWQAAKVRSVPVEPEGLTRETLAHSLTRFAADWLRVLSGETSVALNRVAIAEADSARTDLGAIVLRNGPIAMARRLQPVLEAGRVAGLLRFEDGEAAFRTFFGLVVRDVQIRLLLGDRLRLGEADIETQAAQATRHFFALYGVEPKAAGSADETVNRRI